MKKYRFIVRKSDQQFVSIIKIDENNITETGVNLDLYSVLISDEATARANFTLTGHLPSAEFEMLLGESKTFDKEEGITNENN